MASGSHSKTNKNHSQKHSKKRTKSSKDKTKKPKRRHDSVSFSEEDLVSDSSLSCYSSEDDYKSRRRARSRDRKDRKDRKKRDKRRRPVSVSSGEDSPRVKKQKRLKMSKDSESRKKKKLGKKRRSPSVSSLSGRSKSPCDSDGSEGEFESKKTKERKGRVKGKDRSVSRRDKGKEKSVRKREKGNEKSVSKKRLRSRSSSPCSLHSESHNYDIEDMMVKENNSKRLKSVIVIAHEKEEDEVRKSNWDGNKSEIIFEKDEYPSRSNDSNDGVIRREVSSFSHDLTSEKQQSLGNTNIEIVPSDVQTSEYPESQRLVTENTEGIHSRVDDQLMGSSSWVSIEAASSNCDDLAAVLRQKALENLLKRQGKSSIKDVVNKNGDLNSKLNSSSSMKTDETPHTSNGHNAFKSVQKLGKGNEVNYITDVPSLAKGNDASFPKRVSGTSRLAEKYTAPSGFVDSRVKLGLSTPRREFIGARNTWRRQVVSQVSSLPNPEQTMGKDSKNQLTSQEVSQQNILLPKKAVATVPIDNDSKRLFTSQEVSQPNLSVPKLVGRDSKQQITSQEVSQRNLSVTNAVDLDSSRGSGSATLESTASAEKGDGNIVSQPSAIVENTSNEKINEPDGDKQFQQKTMSVMRGGEMVQVSYKVYIPKKTPALARRQLKR